MPIVVPLNSWDSVLFEFPGEPVTDAVAFAIDSLGYVGTGQEANGRYSNEFYGFSPLHGWAGFTNMILPKAGATVFQLNGAVYLGFGHDRKGDCRDIYRFDPEKFKFTPMHSLVPNQYPGITRSYASSFTLKTNGQEYAYIVGGELGLEAVTPFWHCCRYDYIRDEWEEVPAMPRNALNIVTFTKDNTGYAFFDNITCKFIP